MVFDPSVFTEAVLQGAEAAVKAGLSQVAERARHKAPVRRIFHGDRRIKFKGAVGVQDLLLNESHGPAFRYAERAGTPVGELHGGTAFASPIFRNIRSTGRNPVEYHGLGAAPTERVKLSRDERVKQLTHNERPTVTGRPNSTRPVIRVEGMGRIIGDFREMTAAGKLATEVIYARVNGNTVKAELFNQLTTRGKYEVAHVKTRGNRGEEPGGALRDSIKAVGPFIGTDEVYGFVSAAAFNDDGFNYAYAQEVGTGHNAPQPFLRPALRELHDQIVKGQQNQFRTALQNSHTTRQDYKGFRRVFKLEVTFKGFDHDFTAGLGPVGAPEF